MNSSLRNMVFASLFTALLIVGSYLSLPLPISPVPLVLSDFFVILAGLILGPSWGAMSAGMFLFMGMLGLPVFAGGKAGAVVLIGPTGGYLLGYLLGCGVTGWLAQRQGRSVIVKDIYATILGYAVIFGCGIAWLAWGVKLGWSKALTVGIIPYLPGSLLKATVLCCVAGPLRKLMAERD